MGTFMQGRAVSEQGRAEEGLARMQQGFAALRSTGLGAFLPRFLA